MSQAEANSIPHIKPQLLFLTTSPFLTDRISKLLRQQTCICLFLPSLPVCFGIYDCVNRRIFLNLTGEAVILKPQVFKHDLYVLYNCSVCNFLKFGCIEG